MTFLSPTTGGRDYSKVQFETDLPRIEDADSQDSPPFCNRNTGAGCVNPPKGAAFYPFYSATQQTTSAPGRRAVHSSPNTINNFGGSSLTEYGPLLNVTCTRAPGSRPSSGSTTSTAATSPTPARLPSRLIRIEERLPGGGRSSLRCRAVPLLAANWKMSKGPRETRAFCDAFVPPEGVEAVLCPPYVSLATAVESGQTVFAQNVHWAPDGAYTGEISAPMLLELGVAGAIVGHSERRQYFGETDETVARRTVAALEQGLRVIACVGESEEERESGQMELVLRVQVETIADAAAGGNEGLVIAYEPVWAIGTGKTASPEQARDAHSFIKSLLDVPVLYGGSVKPDNAAELLAQEGIDGALVGGASLEVESFTAICRAAAEIS